MTRLHRTAAALGLTFALLGTSACGSSTELSAERGRTLQTSVLEVTRAAAQGHWHDASVLLESTRALLDAGVERGEVSAIRYRTIDAALDAVESELAAAQQRAATAKNAATTDEPTPQQPDTKATSTRTKATVVRETDNPSAQQPTQPERAPAPKSPTEPKSESKRKGPDKVSGEKVKTERPGEKGKKLGK